MKITDYFKTLFKAMLGNITSDDISYSGPPLPCIGIENCDTLTSAIQKIEAAICEIQQTITTTTTVFHRPEDVVNVYYTTNVTYANGITVNISELTPVAACNALTVQCASSHTVSSSGAWGQITNFPPSGDEIAYLYADDSTNVVADGVYMIRLKVRSTYSSSHIRYICEIVDGVVVSVTTCEVNHLNC